MGNFCEKCGNQLSENSKFCDKCGTPVGARTQIRQAVQSEQLNKKKGCGCLVLVLVVVVFVVGMGILSVPQEALEPKSKQEKNLLLKDITLEEMGITQEQYDNLISILKECGLKDIKSITRDIYFDSDSTKGYIVTEKGGGVREYGVMVGLGVDGNVVDITMGNYVLYENGQVTANLYDYVVEGEERARLQIYCEELVKSQLVSPSSAKFASNSAWIIGKDEEKVRVWGYVEAKNAFGVEIRSDFQVIFTPDGQTVTSFVFDGQELMPK